MCYVAVRGIGPARRLTDEITHAIARLQVIAAKDPAIVGLRWSDENFEILLARQDDANEKSMPRRAAPDGPPCSPST